MKVDSIEVTDGSLNKTTLDSENLDLDRREPKKSTATVPDNSCDTMAIHQINAIQSHGGLVGFTWPDGRIQVVSQNISTFLDHSRKEILGSKLEYVFDGTFLRVLADAVQRYPWLSHGKHLDTPAVVNGVKLDCYLYNAEGIFMLEVERMPEIEKEIDDHAAILQFTQEAKRLESVQEVSQLACRTIRQITGLDRVMMYKFVPPEWHGEVIAEDRIASSHSYLGHRFPATDIPLPARQLYLRNQVRMIVDVHSPTEVLVPDLNPKTVKAIDLSDSRLRAAAPIHIEYLKNMGVGASFSVAVSTGEQLWGLITCHHMKPLQISQTKRDLCEAIAHFCSMQLSLLEKTDELQEQIEFEFKLRKLEENLLTVRDPVEQFFRNHRTATEAFNATGIALISDNNFDFAGLTPLRSDLEALAKALLVEMANRNQNTLVINNLAALFPEWVAMKSYVCGVLAVSVPDLSNGIIMLLRPELIQTIRWGGDPRKNLEKRAFGGEIHPRKSFQTWQETVELQSLPWRTYEVEALRYFRDFVFQNQLSKKNS